MATKTAIINLGNETKKLFLTDSVGLKLITIYLSRLKIIAAHREDPTIIRKSESNISERAKKHETKAKRAVKKIVAPILAYLIISNLGHL